MSAPQESLQPSPSQLSAEVIQHVLLGGDLSRLSPKQRIEYYLAVCEAIGVNPLTRPFDYLRLSGKEVLYARKDCAEQLRAKRNVSLSQPRGELLDTMFTVWVEAKLPDGRTDADMGAVDLGQTKGEQRANLMMKTITKAKRRVTLSICGLGLLDESEISSIPGAKPLNFDPTTGEIHESNAHVVDLENGNGQPKPEGYDNWELDMHAKAEEGPGPLQAAWKAAPVAFRKAMPLSVRDQLKAKAAQVAS
jgi:hypothetical protein